MRNTILNLEESKIREVANAGMGRSDVLAFWFGESDEVTPQFIRDAAMESLAKGETFYAHNLGLPELRDALSQYTSGLHPKVGSDRIAVTSGGVNALMLAVQALVDAGDEVVAITPVWPNLTAQPLIMGAKLRSVSLRPSGGAWALDLQALLDAVTPATKLLIVNAPNNPTGWTLSRPEQEAILAHCRQTGTWILADEVYERLYYEKTPNRCAPSFLDVAAPDDRLVVAHSFSKSFLMTGWRLGWLVMPADMTHHMGKLIEFNTSCASVFTQRAGRGGPAAHRRGDAAGRGAPESLPGHPGAPATGAAPGPGGSRPKAGCMPSSSSTATPDSLETAKRLVAEAGLGLAPGNAFAPRPRAGCAGASPRRTCRGWGRASDRLKTWLAAGQPGPP